MQKPVMCAAAIIGLVCALGLALSFQGWRSRMPDPKDWIFDIESTRELIAHGRIPEHGTVTSYFSYAPPGTPWLFIPGILLFHDPRLAYLPASALLYIATLGGVFLLGRSYFGLRAATLAAVAYGLSQPALELTSVPAPRAHPFFYLAMVYCMGRWVSRRDARGLAAALVICALGLLVFLEMAPLIFIVPAVWLVWRPPIRTGPLALAALVVLLVWFPYLRFEAGRHFEDVRSQVQRKTLERPLQHARTWCDSSVVLPPVSNAAPVENGWVRRVIAERLLVLAEGLVSNFPGVLFGSDLIVLAALLAGFWLCVTARLNPSSLTAGTGWSFMLAMLGAGLMGLDVLEIHRWMVPGWIVPIFRSVRGMVQWLPVKVLAGLAYLAVAGLVFLARKRCGAMLRAMAMRFHTGGDPLLLAISLGLPWMLLLIVAETYRPPRFWWLGALQMIILGAGMATAAEGSRRWRWIGPAVITGLVILNPMLVERVHAWAREGWAGRDRPEAETSDWLAANVSSPTVRIGYPLPAEQLRADWYNVPQSANVDMLLSGHGITNTSQCAEWQSADDDYRVVDTINPRPYVEVPSKGNFRLVQRFDYMEVYRRE